MKRTFIAIVAIVAALSGCTGSPEPVSVAPVAPAAPPAEPVTTDITPDEYTALASEFSDTVCLSIDTIGVGPSVLVGISGLTDEDAELGGALIAQAVADGCPHHLDALLAWAEAQQ